MKKVLRANAKSLSKPFYNTIPPKAKEEFQEAIKNAENGTVVIDGETKTIAEVEKELDDYATEVRTLEGQVENLQGQVDTMSALYNKANKVPDIIDFFLAVYPETQSIMGGPTLSTINSEYAAKNTSSYSSKIQGDLEGVYESKVNLAQSGKCAIFPFDNGLSAYQYFPKSTMFYEITNIDADNETATIIQTDLTTNTEETINVSGYIRTYPFIYYSQMNTILPQPFTIWVSALEGETLPVGFPQSFVGIANFATTNRNSPAVAIQDNYNTGGRIL